MGIGDMGKEVRQFLRLVWGEWSSRVTGSLSALLVLLGLSISIASAFGAKIPSESIIQITTWFLAAVCGGQAAFSVWVRERRIVDELRERIRPKLKCSFRMDDEACVRRDSKITYFKVPNKPFPEGVTITTSPSVAYLGSFDDVTYYRLKVETNSAVPVADCRGRFLWIDREGERVLGAPFILPFWPSENEDALS
jgi:hypothetical protein